MTIKFTVRKNGKSVADLEPYLGALGHCVILSEGARDFLHAHPIEHGGHVKMGKPSGHTLDSPAPGKGEIVFHTQFPKGGIYKVWGQFKHQGQVLTADFVVKVD